MATNEESSENLSLKTLFVRNLPYSTTDSKLENIFSEIGPLKQCFVVKDKGSEKCKGFGYVTFSVREDADKARKEVLKLDGRKVHVSAARKKVNPKAKKKGTSENKEAEPESHQQSSVSEKNKSEVEKPKPTGFKNKHKKPGEQKLTAEWKSKLIVRNLSFKCKDDDLKSAFKQFGDIREVKIPTKPDGKMFGFGFVHFTAMNAANAALQKMNGKEIKGRVVAVDWALPKNRYVEQQKGSKDQESPQSSDESITSENTGNVDDDNDQGSSDGEEDDDDDDNEESNVDESDDEVVDNDVDNDDDDEDDDGTDYDSDDEDEDDDDENKNSKKATVNKNLKSDVDEGKTLFLRNLSFDTEEEDLEEFLSEFGDVQFVRLVIDPNTEHSKGMAFVKFKNKEDADKCFDVASDEANKDRFFLDNRQVYVSHAVSREQAETMKKDKKEKQAKDNRNLFLAREGMIRPGTQAAEGLSKIDLDKRMKVEQLKRQKLKNPLVFISPTRLCVRNIPATVNDKELKAVFVKAVGDKSAKITECRIMRDLNRVNSQGIGKSKGFAFVEFSQHQHALKALRDTNNNPAWYGDKKRLIVEFSLENRSALQLKAKRFERLHVKQTRFDKDKTNAKPNVEKFKQKLKPQTPLKSDVERPKHGTKLGKGLPSHWGPKIRHKPRGNSDQSSTQKKRQAPKPDKRPKEKKPKNKKSRERTDDFDSLVNKHKQRLIGAISGNKSKKTAKSKWFE